MDASSFSEDCPGHLLQCGASAHAFVPNPLPPEIEFTPALVSAVTDARGAVGELAGLTRTLANPYLFVRPFQRREAVASSKIEGTEADLRDVYVFEAGQGMLPEVAEPASRADVREVVNYVRALEYALDRAGELPISVRLIRETHERLLRGVRGERSSPGRLRDSQNWIGSRDCPIEEARYVPPPPGAVAEALADWEAYANKQGGLPRLVRIALLHYQFEAIHPFLDGNGRLGRLLISLLFVHWELLPLPMLYISGFLERRREEYYDRLLRVSQAGEWLEWITFFLSGVTDQSRDTVQRVTALQDLQRSWRETLTEARASAKLLQLADYLFEMPIISIPQAQRELEFTYRGAQLNVEKLVEAGMLTQTDDRSYNRIFAAEEVFRIILGSS